MQITTEQRSNGAARISVAGPFADSAGVEALRSAVSRAAEEKRRGVILDLEGVSFLSSIAVGEIVRSHLSLHRHGRPLVVCGLNERVYTILKVTKVHLILRLAQSLDEADRVIAGA